jgi:hypothetical protein
VAQRRRLVARDEREDHVQRGVLEQGESGGAQDRPPVLGDRLAQRVLGDAAPRAQRGELGGLLQLVADVEPDEPERRGHQERDAPAPVLDLLGGQCEVQHQHDE